MTHHTQPTGADQPEQPGHLIIAPGPDCWSMFDGMFVIGGPNSVPRVDGCYTLFHYGIEERSGQPLAYIPAESMDSMRGFLNYIEETDSMEWEKAYAIFCADGVICDSDCAPDCEGMETGHHHW